MNRTAPIVALLALILLFQISGIAAAAGPTNDGSLQIDTGQTITLTATSTGGKAPYTYTWYQDEACTGTVIFTGNPYTSPALTSNTYYCAKSTDSSVPNVISEAYIEIIVNPQLVAGPITPASPSISSGGSVTLTSHASGGTTPYSYEWYTGSSCNSAISGTNSVTYLASPPTSTYYCYTVTDSSEANQGPETATSSPDLVTVLLSSSTTTFKSSSTLSSSTLSSSTLSSSSTTLRTSSTLSSSTLSSSTLSSTSLSTLTSTSLSTLSSTSLSTLTSTSLSTLSSTSLSTLSSTSLSSTTTAPVGQYSSTSISSSSSTSLSSSTSTIMALSTTTLLGLQSTTTIVYELLGMPPFCTILTIYIDVVNILFILGLMLMVLGGALMAGSQLFPGNMKGTIMGYGIGILVGGIMAVLIGILSPYLVSVLTGLSANQITAAFIKNFIC